MKDSGYFQGIQPEPLLKLLEAENLKIIFNHDAGEYLLKGSELGKLYCTHTISEKTLNKLWAEIDFFRGNQLKEIRIMDSTNYQKLP